MSMIDDENHKRWGTRPQTYYNRAYKSPVFVNPKAVRYPQHQNVLPSNASRPQQAGQAGATGGQPYIVTQQPDQTGAQPYIITTFQQAGVMPQPTYIQQSAPKDYMALSCFAFFCCSLLGLIAILKANQCRNAIARGDYGDARRQSASAREFAIASIVVGVILYIVLVVAIGVFYGVYGGGGDGSSTDPYRRQYGY